MKVIEAIWSRKSSREYQKREISQKNLMSLIDAARLAPSGNNAQPTKYFIVEDEETKTILKENKVFPQDFVYDASAIIVVLSDSEIYTKNKKGLDSNNDLRAIRDSSIASAFLTLRATELGLSTCYIGWMRRTKLKELLNIPAHYLLPFVISVGYSKENAKTNIKKNRKSMDDILLSKNFPKHSE